MYRAVLEILITIIIVAMARALLTSVLKGVSDAARNATGGSTARTSAQSSSSASTGTLHKDPVCGTYVSEATAFQRKVGSQVFFYCSEACQATHQVAARP